MIKDLTSIIVLSRNEKYLNKTLHDIEEKSDGPIEFVVVLDGPPVKPVTMTLKSDLTIIEHPEPLGRRPSTDEAVEVANGEYLFHVDAHVICEKQGWDTIFKTESKRHNDRCMIIPSLDKLDAENWKVHGATFGHKYITYRMKDSWSNIKPVEPFEETICGNGMGWFLTKEYYNALGGCDRRMAKIWGSFGLEWALKVWLTDPDGKGCGKVLLSRDVIFAHLWRENPNPTPGALTDRVYLRKYVDERADNQARPFTFFEDNFKHLIPEGKTGTKRPLLVRTPAVTVIMNTNGLYPELIEEAIYSFTQQDYPNKILKIINTNPQPLQLDPHDPNIEILNIQPFDRFPRQIQFALKQVETPYWTVMDSDDVFSSDHLSVLVNGMLEAKKDGLQYPSYVLIPRAIEQWKGKMPKSRGMGWWCCLYDRVTNEQIDLAFERFCNLKTKDTGSDAFFVTQPWWHRKTLPTKEYTVLHRLGVGFHIRYEHVQPKHYQNGIKLAKEHPLPSVLRPGWREDYQSQIKTFRKSTDNAAITVLMRTWGRSQELIDRAVKSYIDQDYENKRLLIVDQSRTGYRCPYNDLSIDIVRCPGTNYFEQLYLGYDSIQTDLWTVLDDDDYIEPNHLSQLYKYYQKEGKAVINKRYYRHTDGRVKTVVWLNPIWTLGLYDKRTLPDIRHIVNNNLQANDKKIAIMNDPTIIKMQPTYHYCPTARSMSNNFDEKGNPITDHETKTKKLECLLKEYEF